MNAKQYREQRDRAEHLTEQWKSKYSELRIYTNKMLVATLDMSGGTTRCRLCFVTGGHHAEGCTVAILERVLTAHLENRFYDPLFKKPYTVPESVQLPLLPEDDTMIRQIAEGAEHAA